MRNIANLYLFFLPLVGLSQMENNRYTRKNEAADSFQFSKDHCYSRSIKAHGKYLIASCSNGAIYHFNPYEPESIKNLMEKRKFGEIRDLEIIGDTILAMQSGDFGLIARTTADKFLGYSVSEKNAWGKTFLNSMDFYGSYGFILGDPENGQFVTYHTTNNGKNWSKCTGIVEAKPNEFAFAASGTTVELLNDSTIVFVTGGSVSRFLKSTDRGQTWTSTIIPTISDASSGAFSVHFLNANNGVIVGGDYKNPNMSNSTSFYTEDGGKFWMNSLKPVSGYRSCVIQHNNLLFACGSNGIDFSDDGGKRWIPFAHGNYFTMCVFDNKLVATTSNGMIKLFELP